MKGQKPNPKNGHRRSNSRYNGSSDDSDKLSVLVSKSVGKKCIVSVASGVRYEGVLASASTQGPLSVVLTNPGILGKSDGDLPPKLVLLGSDLVDVEVADEEGKSTKSSSKQSSPQPAALSSKFKTDTDISGGRVLKERELQRWVPDENYPTLDLDDTFGSDNGPWDQFKVNEKKFGVESTYDEHLYTTRINTSAPDYQDRLSRADKLAKEIESQTSSDRHVLEERGVVVDDRGMDEEDKYSGVDRRGDELMAALRNASISSDISTSPNINTPGKYVPPRQRAAHYHNDPAIISSSAAPTTKQGGQETPAKKPQTVMKAETALPKAETALPKAEIPLIKPDSVPAKPQVNQPHNESFRLNAQSEINSLREFSANFKIPHKMPTDLLPILAKDKLKQDQILKKQTDVQKKKEQANSANSANPATTATATKKKMDPTKPAFKLNPKAAVFTPSSKQTQLSPNPPKANFQRSPNNPSPRMTHSRPFTSGSGGNPSGGSAKRHHQISPADFFGGSDRIPTKESQEKKVNDFKFAFSLFVTTKKKHDASKAETPLYYERTFQTPPTWDSTVDESHEILFPSLQSLNKGPGMGMPTSPFLPSPLMASQNIHGGYPGPNGSKFPMSPHQQQQQQQQQQQAAAAVMAVHFQQQQQQFHAAMLYQQQFQGGMPPGQPPMPIYPGGEPPFMHPGGFMPPPGSFVQGSSPVNGNLMMGGSPYGGNANNYNNSHHNHNGGNRRYNNQSKRGSTNQ